VERTRFKSVLVALAMVAGTACVDDVPDFDGGLITPPPYGPYCPPIQPGPGGQCNLPSSMSCSYGSCPGARKMAVCQQGTWSVSIVNCQDGGGGHD
jgi:hypothetical protein